MIPRRRATTLSPELVDVLLNGDSVDDPFLEFELQPRDIEALWQEHGDELRAEAARRGIRLPANRRGEGARRADNADE